jgi:PncC family amidohydrolase
MSEPENHVSAAVGGELLPEVLIAAANRVCAAGKQAGLTVGCAESCTGGLVAAALTSVSGVSEGFWGSVTSYDNSVKQGVLGVAEQTLRTVGPVSEECALGMAQGARSALGVDIAVSITGVAGPGGGTPDKPVGTVWFALASATGAQAFLHHFGGDRAEIRCAATLEALRLLAEAVGFQQV